MGMPGLPNNRWKHVLSTCPQDIEEENFRFQNKDLSGYFLCENILNNDDSSDKQDWMLSEFTEWDRGFDFYAPQTFCAAKGRRILIVRAGLPSP